MSQVFSANRWLHFESQGILRLFEYQTDHHISGMYLSTVKLSVMLEATLKMFSLLNTWALQFHGNKDQIKPGWLGLMVFIRVSQWFNANISRSLWYRKERFAYNLKIILFLGKISTVISMLLTLRTDGCLHFAVFQHIMNDNRILWTWRWVQ